MLEDEPLKTFTTLRLDRDKYRQRLRIIASAIEKAEGKNK
jgi:hypothetical protein